MAQAAIHVTTQASPGTRVHTGFPPDGELREFLRHWPHHPHRFCPDATPEQQVDYLSRVLARADVQGAVTYRASQASRLRALLQMESLPWDSRMLGMPAARIAWWMGASEGDAGTADREKVLQAAVTKARQRGVRYLLARVPAGDLSAVRLLERNGFELVDGLLVFGTPLHGDSRPAVPLDGIRCRMFEPADLPALRRIARQSFSIDRFHADPVIGSRKADAIHEQWIESSCAGFADAVLVAVTDVPVGFTTLKLDQTAADSLHIGVGVVVLVATSAEHRGKGIARSLTSAALRWFREQGCRWVEVGTQIANTRASRVYQAAGFSLAGSSLTFRRYFPEGGPARR